MRRRSLGFSSGSTLQRDFAVAVGDEMGGVFGAEGKNRDFATLGWGTGESGLLSENLVTHPVSEHQHTQRPS